jgi:hypothetical protein
MSAFRGKADIGGAAAMSAFDPERAFDAAQSFEAGAPADAFF